jgi:hypothetical protein
MGNVRTGQALNDDYAAIEVTTDQVANNSEAVLDLYYTLRPAWQRDGACRNQTNMMFPGSHRGKLVDYTAALNLCRTCSVKPQCAEWSTQEEHGVWGGIVRDRPRRKDPVEQFLALHGDYFTSRQIADAIGIDVRNAQRRLVRLYEKGTLDRRTTNGPAMLYRYRRDDGTERECQQ